MQEKHYSLTTILNALSKVKNKQAKKRLIFDQSGLSGIGAVWVKAFFISLPIMLYVGIFNDAVFSMLGIAQAIIFYIVFLSMVMILIIAVAFINNNKVLRQVESSWKGYFPDVELKLILSSGATPYKDFFKHYSEALAKGLEDEALYDYMKQAIDTMKIENADLLDMMMQSRD